MPVRVLPRGPSGPEQFIKALNIDKMADAFVDALERKYERAKEAKVEERAVAKEEREVAKEKRTVQESVAKGLLPSEAMLPYTPQRLDPYGIQVPPETPITRGPIQTTIPPAIQGMIRGPQGPGVQLPLPGGRQFIGEERALRQQPEVARERTKQMQETYAQIQAAKRPVFQIPGLFPGYGEEKTSTDRYDELKATGISDEEIYKKLALEGY